MRAITILKSSEIASNRGRQEEDKKRRAPLGSARDGSLFRKSTFGGWLHTRVTATKVSSLYVRQMPF